MKYVRLLAGPILLFLLGIAVGRMFLPALPEPTVRILGVEVVPQEDKTGTILRIVTRYTNSGCNRTMLARFLLNTLPTPPSALPLRQGTAILPIDEVEIIEKIPLGFKLGGGHWHLFSVATCFKNGDPLPAADVAPTALFNVPES